MTGPASTFTVRKQTLMMVQGRTIFGSFCMLRYIHRQITDRTVIFYDKITKKTHDLAGCDESDLLG